MSINRFTHSSKLAGKWTGIALLMLGVQIQALEAAGSPSPVANVCGPPPGPAEKGSPVFPEGQYPVKLPPVSLLGAPNNLPDPFGAGVDWGDLPAGRTWGGSASVIVDKNDHVWVADRCGHAGAVGGESCNGGSATIDPIIELDTSGKFIKSLGAGLFVSPHKMEIDKDGNIWVADNGSDQVIKMDPDGKVLMTLGKKGIAGSGNDEFDAPTDVAFGANGTFFVSDGHSGGGSAIGNARVQKFDRNGNYLMTIGHKGMGPGEFDVPHALAMDKRGRLFVGDRQNNRVQIFNQNGKHLATWYQFGRPSGIFIDGHDTIYVSDSESRDGRTNIGKPGIAATGYGYDPGAERGVRIGSALTGKVRFFIPDMCPYPYSVTSHLAEGVAADHEGHVYTADVRGDIRKFVKK